MEPTLNFATIVVIGVLAVMAGIILLVSYFCFNDKDPDMDWYNNYSECERPHIALKCQHTGDKTIRSIGSVVNCETVELICCDCGEILKKDTECR